MCKSNGLALQYVPSELRTYELCKLASESNGWMLYCVPRELRTYELCTIACRKCDYALE